MTEGNIERGINVTIMIENGPKYDFKCSHPFRDKLYPQLDNDICNLRMTTAISVNNVFRRSATLH